MPVRDYDAMRDVMSVVAASGRRLGFLDFSNVMPNDLVEPELQRLIADGLVEGEIRYNNDGVCQAFGIDGLTDEGRAFWRLIESGKVWLLIRSTLFEAGIDVSYPLLKEVCEEIVKRYVISFIPKTL